MTSASGSRAYTRTLFFVLCKAVQDIYPNTDVVIDIPVSNGFYVDIRLGRLVVDEDVNILRRYACSEIIDSKMPIRRFTVPTEGEAIALFQEKGDVEKVKLLKTSGSIYTTYYKIGEYVDYYYGTLLTNTSQLYLFGLEKYYDGMLLRIPSVSNPDVLGEMTRQDKMFDIFKGASSLAGNPGYQNRGRLQPGYRRGAYYGYHQYKRGTAGEEAWRRLPRRLPVGKG